MIIQLLHVYYHVIYIALLCNVYKTIAILVVKKDLIMLWKMNWSECVETWPIINVCRFQYLEMSVFEC